jgi:hypothetical protein
MKEEDQIAVARKDAIRRLADLERQKTAAYADKLRSPDEGRWRFRL